MGELGFGHLLDANPGGFKLCNSTNTYRSGDTGGFVQSNDEWSRLERICAMHEAEEGRE